jgi:hypothetical protein
MTPTVNLARSSPTMARVVMLRPARSCVGGTLVGVHVSELA